MVGGSVFPRQGEFDLVDKTLIYVAALLLLLGAGMLLRSDSSRRYRERVRNRMQLGEHGSEADPTLWQKLMAGVADRLAAGGVEPRPVYGWLLTIMVLLALAIGGFYQGMVGLLAAPPILLAVLYLLWSWRLSRRASELLDMLPGFLGHVLRALRSGTGIEQALESAVNDAEGISREVFERVLRQTRLGLTLDQALLRTADVYGLRELDMLALGLRVTQRYGGDLGQIMEQIVSLIRQRQQASAELRALTGETRLSAWILGLLPISIAAYILVVNPNYLDSVLATEGGRILLAGAVIWQILGLLVIRRMVRSV